MPLARHDPDEEIYSATFIISTHMPLARHDASKEIRALMIKISTHMPLARHDAFITFKINAFTVISTHMPLARHDLIASPALSSGRIFLLTCLLRGMTILPMIASVNISDFYSHASCEA